MDIRLVTVDREVAEALGDLVPETVGVDVERSDSDNYFRSAALIQVGYEDTCVVIDPLADVGLDRLADALDDRFVVLHAVENDLEPLDDVGVRLAVDGAPHREIADTAIAAALLGLPTGLGPLLAELLGVQLTADKERFQRADWTQRPLPGDMLDYAAGDVVHLPRLWREIETRLRDTDRLHWYEEELAHTVERAREEHRSWRRTKGADRLDGQARAVLRELWEEREEIARTEDIAPQLVTRDDALVALAEDPPTHRGDLRARGVRGRQVREHGERLLEAARRGIDADEVESLSGVRPATDEDRSLHDRLRRARAGVAREIGLDPGVVCPNRVLWQAVLADPEGADELCAAAGLRPWQRELLADVLWESYTEG